jgi:cobyrinic acid a,c-diamide synthase
MSGILISAAHKSSGKTTIAIGLCAAFSSRGVIVQSFKKGPDYIDPMWLTQASGRACFNLDPYLMTSEQIGDCFAHHSATADIAIVEGNKGLYDGLALDGSNSNAALAKLLDLPVVLVLDARGMTRGIAPLILGYQAFDRQIQIAGVILNQLGGSRHESKLRAVIEHYTNVKILGAIGCDPSLSVVERHLGLIPNHEHDDAQKRVHAMGERVAQQVNLDSIRQLAQDPVRDAKASANGWSKTPNTPSDSTCDRPSKKLRIGIARDRAFGFYYPDDLIALERVGADIVPVDTLNDTQLPELDGLFIGGGFPEVFMEQLQANTGLRTQLRAAIEANLPVYAECGGLMYLARTLRWKEQIFDMVGAIAADVVMHERPVGRGYVELQTTGNAPWPSLHGTQPVRLRGHEFHYSSLENIDPALSYAYRVLRGHGIDGHHDGIVYKNVLASYAHLRDAAGSNWVGQFIECVRVQKALKEQKGPSEVRKLLVNGKAIATDVEGYLSNVDEWNEDFVRVQAATENLELTEAHWQVITFLRSYFEEHRVQAQVCAMIWHFAQAWGPERGNNHHLHTLFPAGGPQKQGNRLAGLLKTKGEH